MSAPATEAPVPGTVASATRADYDRVADLFERFLVGRPEFATLPRLLDGARDWPEEVGGVGNVIGGDRAGPDWSAAEVWARFGCGVVEARAAAQFASGLDPAGRVALGALVRRGHDGFDALDTVPLEALFSTDEVARIRDRPRDATPVADRPVEWTPGKPFGYGGVIAVIMKVTRICNMRCTYCLDWRSGPDQTMTFDVMLDLFSGLFGEDAHRHVQVIWHGGEPTLIGRREFLRILRLQRWFLRQGQKLGNRVQTNATLVDDSWIRLWSRFGIKLSASIDGDRTNHDRQRPMAGGRASYDRVRRGIGRLSRAGLLEHLYWVITPGTARGRAEAVWAEIQALGAPEIGLLPARVPGAHGAENASGDSFAGFLLNLRAARAARPAPWVAIREIDAAERATRGEMPGFCELLGNCLGHVFAVDPDGTIQHCDRFIGDTDYVLGHVARGGFPAARQGPRIAVLRARERARLDRLRACPHFALCQGWCPHVSHAPQPWIGGADPACCGMKPLFDGIANDERHG